MATDSLTARPTRRPTTKRVESASSAVPRSGFPRRGIICVLTPLVVLEGNDVEEATTSAVEAALLLSLRTYIRTHLHDPPLFSASVAAAHNIPVRHLYRLY